ncbi:hypothetical protein ACFY0G_17600 [Streptomyces sp. NPDC001552]|uniref:hypothetical protein n=1 Tax=Streptomyces sp. NPDC001552 TaxID=3364587 RepID=UPI0036BFC2FA
MNATAALTFITARANMIFAEDKEARTRLSDALAVDAAHIDSLVDAVLVTAGKAKPWRQLLKRIERLGVRKGLAAERQLATDNLLNCGVTMSTSLVTNAACIADQEGLRRFLRATEGFEIDADAAPAPIVETAPAPQPEAPAAPAAQPTATTPKVTPGQRRALVAIRDTNIRLQEFTVRDGVKVLSDDHDNRPRRDMIEFAIDKKWAQRDNSTTMLKGQSVTLTALGASILAA